MLQQGKVLNNLRNVLKIIWDSNSLCWVDLWNFFIRPLCQPCFKDLIQLTQFPMNSMAVRGLKKEGCEGGRGSHLDWQIIKKTSLSDHITAHLAGDMIFAVNSLFTWTKTPVHMSGTFILLLYSHLKSSHWPFQHFYVSAKVLANKLSTFTTTCQSSPQTLVESKGQNMTAILCQDVTRKERNKDGKERKRRTILMTL